jgi:hypothetical protein
VKKEARWLKVGVESDPTLSNVEKEEEYHVTVTVLTGKLLAFVHIVLQSHKTILACMIISTSSGDQSTSLAPPSCY